MKLILSLIVLLFISLPGFGQEESDLTDEVQKEKARHSEEINSLIPLKRKPFQSQPGLLDEKVVRELLVVFKDNPLSKVSPEEIKAMVLEKAAGQPPVQKFLSTHPRLMNCIVDLLRDEKAMHSALQLFLKKDQLKLYGMIWIFLFIIQWLFKKIFFNKNWGLFKRFVLNLLVAIVFTVTSLSVFYRLFRPELSPTVGIIKKHLFLKQS